MDIAGIKSAKTEIYAMAQLCLIDQRVCKNRTRTRIGLKIKKWNSVQEDRILSCGTH